MQASQVADEAYRNAVVARDASDLASWEALRAAAKGTEDYEALVQASSKLANEGGDGGRVELLAAGRRLLDRGHAAPRRARPAAARVKLPRELHRPDDA